MKKMINKTHIEGRIYDHNLAIKKVQNTESENFGKDFIGGTLDIATDEDGVNIVTVNFTYVVPTFKSGSTNATYNELKNIIENGKTILVDGIEEATKVKVDSAIELNDFYTNRNGEETLVSAKRNGGGFVKIVSALDEDESKRNTFEVDMLINGARDIEANEERGIKKDYLMIKGAIFNFRGDLMPVEFAIKNEGGIKYFQSLDASPNDPVFTKVWGNIVSLIIKEDRTEESAWGDPIVKTYEKKVKEWVVTGTKSEPYVFDEEDDEAGLKPSEVKEALQKREVHLAEVKKNAEEYKAKKAASAGTKISTGAISAADGGFDF